MSDSFERAAQDAEKLATRIRALKDPETLAATVAQIESEWTEMRAFIVDELEQRRKMLDELPERLERILLDAARASS